jgi:hypothetical protein
LPPQASNEAGPTYDRDFLLSEAKRNQVLELWEVQRFGLDSFGDPEYKRIYGLAPTEWYAHGVRLLARTTLEAVRDPLGQSIGQDVARLIRNTSPAASCAVVDPFAGSCNGLDWIVRSLPCAHGIGYEADRTIFELSQRNLALLDRPIELLHGDYKTLLGSHQFPPDQAIVAFLAPPWGDALSAETGLDLGRTHPPIAEIVADFERVYPAHPILYVTQIFEHLEPAALAILRAQFDWSALRIYDLDPQGIRHGALFGTQRWPEAPTL